MLMPTDQICNSLKDGADSGQLELPISLTFPHGMVGLPMATIATLQRIPGEEPFMWLSFENPEARLNFLVIEPNGIVENYNLELFDQDADELEIRGTADAFVLNVVTMRETVPATASVNLTGPIIVNRHTLRAKQVVISNYMNYRTPYILGEG